MEEKFIKGLFAGRREQAPEFVKANLSIKTEEFIEWLKGHTNSKGYCQIDILESKTGSLYAKHNDWKPEERFVKNEDGSLGVEDREYDIDLSSVPF